MIRLSYLEILFYLFSNRENGYHGILGDHPEYCIFDPPRYFSAHKMKLTVRFTLETQEIVMDEVTGLDISNKVLMIRFRLPRPWI